MTASIRSRVVPFPAPVAVVDETIATENRPDLRLALGTVGRIDVGVNLDLLLKTVTPDVNESGLNCSGIALYIAEGHSC